MTKYREIYLKMLKEHKDLFDQFRPVHDKYTLDMPTHQEEFNKHGAGIMETIRDWEDKLCGRSEGSGYGSFTGNLAEKFMEEVRKEFPMIDRVGIIITQPQPKADQPLAGAFELNRISPLNNNFDLKKIDF